ncbi:hypothetical protein AVEN_176215-1 [Araneus ventricosus]|uniref:Uncharacterized protein n=1 Tax=Araneus ventricosus TaxID=182803 RepID=A0A4Y2IJX9_ARAVE|nr:hypothetical protein AVEN_176215-1 [Araneus ventricosus]
MDKVRLLPSGVQGLVPTEAALSSFTMRRSPIVLIICSHVWSWRRGTSLKFLHWFVIFCGPADNRKLTTEITNLRILFPSGSISLALIIRRATRVLIWHLSSVNLAKNMFSGATK